MIDSGWTRKTINKQVGRVQRIFRWGVSKELIEPGTYQRLKALDGLRQGRTRAKDRGPVMPVVDDVVDATLEHLGPIVGDMVRLQRLTGCRPDEVCGIRPCDVSRSADVWVYRPESHKTQHHGRERLVFIGPKAQAILAPYLLRETTAYCFTPAEAEEQFRRAKSLTRRTPLSCGNRSGSKVVRHPQRRPGDRYDANSYRRAIHRACDAAFIPPELLRRKAGETKQTWLARLTDKQRHELRTWQSSHRWSPNRLRHAAATEIRSRFGLEAAQVTLGHAAADVTQIYAERDMTLAVRVAREVG
jgi:integrase